jgi:sulfatase maturation enzyme AslB (radical SAM superfamily)
MNKHTPPSENPKINPILDPRKFLDPDTTAKGEPRAKVPLTELRTLWINTGTLCNIECAHCYIKSSPTNDRLAFFEASDLSALLDEIRNQDLPVREIAFTGGEPFINPDTPNLIRMALEQGFRVLVLTNAMRPLMRQGVQAAMKDLQKEHPGRLTLRISLDHFREDLHDKERGPGSFASSLKGLMWLAENEFAIDIAGRTCFQQSEIKTRAGFQNLFSKHALEVDANDPRQLILFPEMDETADTPEITEACWKILGKAPENLMCSQSRMVVKRKGDTHLTVLPCTLLPDDTRFDMGHALEESFQADGAFFDKGAVKLNHPHCAKFCVLGGGSCTA